MNKNKLLKNKVLIISVAIVTIISIIIFWFYFSYLFILRAPIIKFDQQPVNFLFTQGMSVKKLAFSLKKEGLIKYPITFYLVTRYKTIGHSLKAGEYRIDPGVTTPLQLLDKMIKGEAIRHAFTIIEGWTFSQVLAALNNNFYIKHTMQQQLTQQQTIEEIMSRIGHSGELPEGRFAPDTYLFSGEVKDIAILLNAYKLMQKRLHKAWSEKAANASYKCPYEALIVASMLEKETALAQEKSLIAGVILRRLAQNKLLQVDPTVIYGLGDKYNGKLTKKDLAKDTSYNTYIHKGLPPTPISMPSEESIIAALHPIIDKAMYYVSKGNGSHKFSETLKEQGKAIKKYLKRK
jgi:UPF0755 protein